MINEYAPFFIIGIATGSIYAIAAMGLVLTYKTSGVFNFGHGAVGAAGAYVFWDLTVQHGISWPIAAAIAIFGFGTIGGILLELIGRGLAQVVPAMKIVGTVGILVGVQGLIELHYGDTSQFLPQFLPIDTVEIGGLFVSYNQIIVAIIALASAVGLYLFFKLTRTGNAMRAVVDDADLLDMTGVSPVRVRRFAWILGAQFATLAGILIAPILGLDAGLLTLLVVQAFGAAAVGRFTSLPMTYVGALMLGVLRELTGKWVGQNETLAALPAAVPFLMLFVILLVTRRGKLPDFGRLVRARVRTPRPPSTLSRVGVGVFLLCALAVPHFAGLKTIVWATGLVFVGLFLSLGFLTRLSGMVSLCQVGLMGIGAASFGHFQGEQGKPWFLALLLAGLVAVPFGAVVAIPAIRLSGLYLALGTFGYAILLEQIVYRSDHMFGTGGVTATRPSMFQSDTAYYYLVLGVTVALAALVRMMQRARLGRMLQALGDSPRALSTHGASINVTRVLVFCIAAFVAGVSGGLYVPLFGAASGDSFLVFQSLIVLAVLAIAGTDIVRAAFVASLLFFVLPSLGDGAAGGGGNSFAYLFGLAAIVVALTSNGAGPRAWLERMYATSRWRTTSSPVLARWGGVNPAAGLPQQLRPGRRRRDVPAYDRAGSRPATHATQAANLHDTMVLEPVPADPYLDPRPDAEADAVRERLTVGAGRRRSS